MQAYRTDIVGHSYLWGMSRCLSGAHNYMGLLTSQEGLGPALEKLSEQLTQKYQVRVPQKCVREVDGCTAKVDEIYLTSTAYGVTCLSLNRTFHLRVVRSRCQHYGMC